MAWMRKYVLSLGWDCGIYVELGAAVVHIRRGLSIRHPWLGMCQTKNDTVPTIPYTNSHGTCTWGSSNPVVASAFAICAGVRAVALTTPASHRGNVFERNHAIDRSAATNHSTTQPNTKTNQADPAFERIDDCTASNGLGAWQPYKGTLLGRPHKPVACT